ncbi:hypothetical protein BUQ74_17625 [Leptospira weilii serovar Heyan]|nr:hypothetical protein BUQ74_17625 [Leptospira weilii serovar Heyan]
MGTKFQRGFVVIPTDFSSDPSICGVGDGRALPCKRKKARHCCLAFDFVPFNGPFGNLVP